MASSSLSTRPSFYSESPSSSRSNGSPKDLTSRQSIACLPGSYFRFADRLVAPSLQRHRHSKVPIAAEGQEASSISSETLVGKKVLPAPALSGSKVNLPPRVCTLREFGEGMIAFDPDLRVSSFFESLAATIEFTSKVQDWEILSGRLAMMVFASTVVLEAVTGNSVFEKMDGQRILEICAAIITSMIVAAGFAVALQAKTRVAYTMSKGYENLMNALIDNVIDSLLFDDDGNSA